MARVEIVQSLKDEVLKKLKKDSKTMFRLMQSLGENPQRGKTLSTVAGIVIKELKYKNFRFYFVTDGFKLKCMGEKELVDLLLRFVRMSDKKHQQKTINEIKNVLQTLGPMGFK
ncbi:MAG: hypothetical protein CMH61_00395 [Nanoarchaeota archaeon]|nr:hypothetical protein [Nanoarchaeota archaeon]